MVLCCCLSHVSAQRVETTIDLSPLGGVRVPTCMAVCPGANKTWVAGQTVAEQLGRVAAAFDGTTLDPVGKASIEADVVSALCYCSANNKLYVANSGLYTDGHTLTVIDCGTGRVLTSVNVPQDPEHLCYNPTSNKIYCADAYASVLTIVDCASDVVLTELSCGRPASDLLWAPPLNDVYVANCRDHTGRTDSMVSIVSGELDTIVANVEVGLSPTSLCYNSKNQKVYCAIPASPSANPTVSVIDCWNHSLVHTIHVQSGPGRLCYNSIENKIYCGSTDNDTSLIVIDGSADTVMRALSLSGGVTGVCYDRIQNKVYCLSQDPGLITILDGATDTVIRALPTGPNPTALCDDSVNDHVYCANSDATVTVVDCKGDSLLSPVFVGLNNPKALCYSDSLNSLFCAYWPWGADHGPYPTGVPSGVMVIDGAANTVLAQELVGRQPSALLLNQRQNKLYCVCYMSDSVYVLDAVTLQLLRELQVGDGPRALCCDSARNRLYCANDSSGDVTIIDCKVDSVTATVPAGNGPRALAYNPANDELYCANERSNDITAIDCGADTVVATIAAETGPSALCLDARRNKLYCASYVGEFPATSTTTVIDCAADTVVAALPTGGSPLQDICYGSVQDEVYCGYTTQFPYAEGVAAIACGEDTIAAKTTLQLKPRALLFDSTNNYLFVAMYQDWPYTGKAAIIDVGRRKAYSTPWLGTRSQSLAWNPSEIRLYVANSSSGTISVIKADSVGIADRSDAIFQKHEQLPTMIRGVLLFEPANSDRRIATGELLDVAGRRVMDLRPGANDVRALAPGVYFVRTAQAQAQAQAVRKVVLTE